MFLIRFALILLLVFIIIRLVARFVLNAYIKNARQNFEQRNGAYNQKEEGDVTINTNPAKGKKFKSNEGDYVDYEEIDE